MTQGFRRNDGMIDVHDAAHGKRIGSISLSERRHQQLMAGEHVRVAPPRAEIVFSLLVDESGSVVTTEPNELRRYLKLSGGNASAPTGFWRRLWTEYRSV